jgi:hypothetical protein
MDQDKTDPAQRPQTLLEAAKAIVAIHGTTWPDFRWYDLRAAIAREEAKVHVPLRGLAIETAARIDAEMIGMLSASDAKATLVTALDRAQQAESSAAWHKAESERLSAQVADMRQKHDAMCSDSYHASIRRELQAWPTASTVEAATSLRQRAEKAEAELAKARQARQLDRAVDVLTKIEPRDPTTGFTFATYRRLLEALGGKS